MGLGHAAVAGVAQVGAADGLGDGAFDTGTLGVGGAPLGGGLGLPGAELRLPHGPGWTVILLHLRKVVHPAGHRVGVDLVQQRAAVRADLLGQPAAEAFLRFSSREASTLRPRPRERGCDGVVDAAGDEDEQRVVQIAGGPGG